MKIRDILSAGRPTVSFEVFPSKRDAPLAPVKEAVRRIAAERPAFVSVTYGAAGGEKSANTSELAAFVQRDCGVTALAHLTCVGTTRSDIAHEAEKLRALGIENILALRGDPTPLPPSTPTPPPTPTPHFHYAAELVAYLKENFPDFCLGGACYPEGHPECAHLDEDIAHLKVKQDAGLDFLTTQMFFDNNVYFRYLARLRNADITVPVIAGIMPVTNVRQIERICKLSGTILPPRFAAIVDRFGERPDAMLDAGVAYATEQIIDLFANGAEHVHVYTMNKPEVAARIMGNLRAVLSD